MRLSGPVSCAAALTVVLASSAARADGYTSKDYNGQDDPAFRPVSAERRAGFVLGGSLGVGFAGASGYPNDSKLIGDPAYYAQSPLLLGTATSIFMMGAFSDYVSFGPMVDIATFENDQWKSTGLGVGFRGEIFPFVRLLPALADTALFSQLGIGSTKLEPKGPYRSVDGVQSFLGIGVHHEFRLTRLLGGHLSGGPFIEYNAVTSESAERHWLSVGLRAAWYGGTVKADSR